MLVKPTTIGKTVAVLCAAKKSSYRDIPGVEVYDQSRDAQTFAGGVPVIAHPPCRTWSNNMRHFVRISEEEKLAGSPQSSDSFSLAVWQAWWGYPVRKATWLYFRGIRAADIEIPFRLFDPPKGSQRVFLPLLPAANTAAPRQFLR